MEAECPAGWRLVNLRELGEVNRGRSRHRPRYAEHLYGGPYPFIQTGDVKASNGRITSHTQTYSEAGLAQSRLWPAGTMCITIAANIAETGILTFPACFPDSVVGFIADPNNADVQFIEYMFRFMRSEIQHQATGSVQDNINIETLERLLFPLPPLPEQKAIASVLGALDDKIEVNRRMNATLEAMARALFQSWFVDFAPVRAKSEGRQPEGMDADTAALFPAEFEDSELGMIPKGWRVGTIQDVSAINNWTLGKSDNFETLEYIEISEVHSGNIGTISTYLRGDEPSRARRRLRHGDTVLSTVRPDRGAYFLSLNPPENRVASTGFAVFTPTMVPWSFLHVALTLPDVSDHLGHMADGGAYPAVRPEIIGAIEIALPDKPIVLNTFHQTCSLLFEQANRNRDQSRALAALRDTLLPKLLSGELRVGDLEPLPS